MPYTLIAPTEAAVEDPASIVIQQPMLPATIYATGLDSAEDVTLWISNGDDFVELFQDGTEVKLTEIANALTVNSPMVLGATKTASADEVGVFVSHSKEYV